MLNDIYLESVISIQYQYIYSLHHIVFNTKHPFNAYIFIQYRYIHSITI